MILLGPCPRFRGAARARAALAGLAQVRWVLAVPGPAGTAGPGACGDERRTA
jgi:hypothetical protein